ncbi:MAG: 30S ribosomal protein S17 [Nitriliruptorales bacterium]
MSAEFPSQSAAGSQTKRGIRKERIGLVVSDSPDKTIVVRVDRRTTHGLYGKTLVRSKKYYAHDERNEGRVGDRVRIAETRPLSKLKRWRLVEIVERAK